MTAAQEQALVAERESFRRMVETIIGLRQHRNGRRRWTRRQTAQILERWT